MKKHLFLVAFVTSIFSNTVLADMYKRIEADGRVVYSSMPAKGAIRLEPIPNMDSERSVNKRARTSTKRASNQQRIATATPEDFPRVDRQTQSSRDNKRKEILQGEMESERLALAQSKKVYTESTANGQALRDMAKMKDLREEIDSHQKNIELLQKEIDSLR